MERLLAQVVNIDINPEEVEKVAARRQRVFRQLDRLVLRCISRCLLVVSRPLMIDLVHKGNAVQRFALQRFW